MIYKFKSKSAGDVIMMKSNGDEVLGIIGKSADAQGIIETADMPAAIAAIERAVAADDEFRRQAAEKGGTDGKPGPGVTLRQRAWPLVEMMKRSHAEGNDIVWGV